MKLEPETVLPGQFREGTFGTTRLRPATRLQLAVLEDALLTLHRCLGVERPETRHRLAEVDAWFASEDTDWPFAFVTICHTLGLDPGYIRRGLADCRAAMKLAGSRKPPLRRDIGGMPHRVVRPRRAHARRRSPEYLKQM
jgi:hypothetical protein